MSKILAEATFRTHGRTSEMGGRANLRYLVAAAMAFVTLVTIAGFFLLRYPLHGFRYPVGWDAPWYVWRAKAVTFDGLARLGTVRAATPLALSMLMRATGQNSFTVVALAAPLFAGVAGVAVAAMVRSALGTRLIWLPVIGMLTWVAFGGTGLLSGYIDQTLNVTFALAGFASAVAFISGGRGALAAMVLFMAAGLAEWPFYGFAVLILCVGLFLFVLSSHRSLAASMEVVRPLSGAVLASGVFTVLTLVGIPSIGRLDLRAARGPESLGTGRRLSPKPAMRRLLKRRFLDSIRETTRYLGLALATLGGVAAARVTVDPVRRDARRFFLCLMVAWALLTAAAAMAQILGAPVAGARLLLYLFAVPILIAALLWVAARFVRGSLRAPIGGVIAVLLVLGTVGALMARVWHGDQRRTWVESKAVAQLAAAGDYLARFAPGRGVVFSFRKGGGTTIVRWKNTVRAGLPPGVVPRVRGWALGSPIDQLNALSPGGGTGSGSTGGASGPIIVVIEAYNRPGFEDAHLAYPDSFVSPGVLALNGPIAPTVIPEKRAASANTHGANLLWLAALAAAILLAVGGGWSIVLLPTDPVVRAALAPALGLGASVLAALVWDRLALGLHGWRGVGPLVIAACAGWGVAWLRMIRLRRVPDGQVPRGPVGDGAPIEPPPAASAVP
ncbi:MAG TPA: hypothetical protein VEQ37_14170 [Actinomycetota bacterium]|nr:hypothetical protein [Actinomycetota bacterium]